MLRRGVEIGGEAAHGRQLERERERRQGALGDRDEARGRALAGAAVEEPPQDEREVHDVEHAPERGREAPRGASLAPVTAVTRACSTRSREKAVAGANKPSSPPTSTGTSATSVERCGPSTARLVRSENRKRSRQRPSGSARVRSAYSSESTSYSASTSARLLGK